MRDYHSPGEHIINGILAVLWLLSRPFKWLFIGLYRLALAVWGNFYTRPVAFLGGLAFVYFIAYITGLIR